MRTQSELVAIIAQRLDSGARVNIGMIANELGEDRYEVLNAYYALARQRGHDPLLKRAERSIQRLREIGRAR